MPGLFCLLLAGLLPAATPEDPRVEMLELDGSVEALAFRDLDGDGLLDLVVSDPAGLSITLQDETRAFPARPDQRLSFEENAVAWDVADLDGRGGEEIVTIEGGQTVRVYRFDEASGGLTRETRPLIENAGGLLPDDVRHVAFLRDLDGDGDRDVVIPAGPVCRLYLNGSDGHFFPGPEIAVDQQVDLEMDCGENLADELREEIRLPLFELVDVNADGRPDVVSQTPEIIRTFLAGRDGRLPTEPTFELDIRRLEDRLKRHDDEPDLANLAAGISERVETRTMDCNQDGCADYLVRTGNKIALFLGGPGGVDFTRPRQILKTSGNIITFFAVDDDGDGRPDLHILRVETISIGDVLLWLVKSGSLRFDLFIYANQGADFARRPTRHLTLTLLIPALMGFSDRANDLVKEIAAKASTPAVAFDLDGDGQHDDIALIEGQRIQAYRNAVPSGWTDKLTPVDLFHGFMRRLGYNDERDDYTVDLEAFDTWIPLPASELARQAATHRPEFDASLPLPESTVVPYPSALDLDADGHDDLVILQKAGDDRVLRVVIVRPG